MFVAWRYRDELRKPLAEPHGDVSVHVDSKRLVALLQATDGEELQRAHVFSKVHPAYLTYAQTAYWDKTCLAPQSARKTVLNIHKPRTHLVHIYYVQAT